MGIFSGIGSVVGGLFGSSTIGGALGTALDGIIGRNDQSAINAQTVAEAQKNRDFQASQAQAQMDFQERMSSSSYQRGVKDLQAAGLNPMLAYTQGGASTPGGAAASGSPTGALSSAVSAGMHSSRQSAETMQALQQMAMSRAQIEQVRAQTDKIKSETMDQQLNSAILAQQIKESESRVVEQGSRAINVDQDTANKMQANKLARHTFEADVERRIAESGSAQQAYWRAQDTFAADVARRKAESSLTQMEIPKSKAESDFYDNLGKANPYLQQILMLIKGVSSARGVFR